MSRGVDESPEAAVAAGAAEGNFSGQAGAKELDEIFAMRAESGVMCRNTCSRSALLIVGDYSGRFWADNWELRYDTVNPDFRL